MPNTILMVPTNSPKNVGFIAASGLHGYIALLSWSLCGGRVYKQQCKHSRPANVKQKFLPVEVSADAGKWSDRRVNCCDFISCICMQKEISLMSASFILYEYIYNAAAWEKPIGPGCSVECRKRAVARGMSDRMEVCGLW